MPPMLSDDESDGSGPEQVPARPAKQVLAVASDDKIDEDEPAKRLSDDEEEDEDEADEYAVEKILKHSIVKGKVVYQIKWMGYDAEEDLTWEPIDNLSGSKDLLDKYHDSIGGVPQVSGKGGKKGQKKGDKKRAAAETEVDSPAPSNSAPAKKRGRKSATANGSSEKSWEPPLGSWEDEIQQIAAILQDEGLAEGNGKGTVTSLEGMLVWNDGKKTQHKMSILRKKCPQKLLDYYEQHLLKPKLMELGE